MSVITSWGLWFGVHALMSARRGAGKHRARIQCVCLPTLCLACLLPAAGAEPDAPVFEEHFESKAAVEARGGVVAPGIEFKPGKEGNAAFFTGAQAIRFSLKDFKAPEGTIEFWEAIAWPNSGTNFRCAAQVMELSKKQGDESSRRLVISHSGNNYGYTRELGIRLYNIPKNGPAALSGTLAACCLDWISGQWYKVSLTYKLGVTPQDNEVKFYINGALQDHYSGFAADSDGLFDTLTIGRAGDSTRIAVDELRIYAYRKSFASRHDNLVSNYSFEHDVNVDGRPDFWSQFGKAGTGYWGGLPATKPEERGINVRTDHDAFSGKYSVRMEGKEQRVGGQIIGVILGLEPNLTYEFDAAVKSSQPQVSFLLMPYDTAGKAIAEKKKKFTIRIPQENLNKWLMLSETAPEPIRFEAPANCRYARVYLLIKNKQIIYWDDIFFYQTETKTNRKDN